MFILELIVLGFVQVMVYVNQMDVCKLNNSKILIKWNILFRCNHGYVQPFCSLDPLIVAKSEISAIELNANLSLWSEIWGYEKCSSNDERYVFSKAGSRGLISPEILLIGIKSLRIQLDTCFNQTQTFLDPIYVQISLNNGILWQTLMTIIYRREPWLIQFSNDETMKLHFVRIRLFQRVTTSILNKKKKNFFLCL